jgi:spore coat polysaccharide biosynthesis protein SpsF (cytidylyltransferase family)
MTLDTSEDFQTLSEIYLKLVNKYDRTFGLNEIIQFLDIEKDYKRVMMEQIIVNTK